MADPHKFLDAYRAVMYPYQDNFVVILKNLRNNVTNIMVIDNNFLIVAFPKGLQGAQDIIDQHIQEISKKVKHDHAAQYKNSM